MVSLNEPPLLAAPLLWMLAYQPYHASEFRSHSTG